MSKPLSRETSTAAELILPLRVRFYVASISGVRRLRRHGNAATALMAVHRPPARDGDGTPADHDG